ncbi:MAG TPA: alpha/beta hydrolase [Solirubrobacterales bacterium]|nr:alpha/beta hydrolase [Solirubrobacterales bacterium]
MYGLSEERLAPVNGIEIAYQEIGDPGGEPLMLVMGLGMQMLGWHEELCGALAARGFRVVRFDNRDIGCSTKMDSAGVPNRLDMFLGRRSTAAYLLQDMAADIAGLMDHLEIESAHMVGASMGGMIAQTLAIGSPERVRTLVSMMSTTGNLRVGRPAAKTFGTLMAHPARSREGAIEQALRTFRVIGSPGYPMDERHLRDVAGASYDRGHSRAGVVRQMHAITASGDRTPALRELRLPATVIHGSCDPLINPSGGRATAAAIPGARLRIIEGMGHDLPRLLWPTFVDEIAATAALIARESAAV